LRQTEPAIKLEKMQWLETKLPPLVLLAFLLIGMYCLSDRTWFSYREGSSAVVAEWISWLGGIGVLFCAGGVWSILAGINEFKKANTTVNPTAPSPITVPAW